MGMFTEYEVMREWSADLCLVRFAEVDENKLFRVLPDPRTSQNCPSIRRECPSLWSTSRVRRRDC